MQEKVMVEKYVESASDMADFTYGYAIKWMFIRLMLKLVKVRHPK